MSINIKLILSFITILICNAVVAQKKKYSVEKNGIVTIEAENFVKQISDSIRKWQVFSIKQVAEDQTIANKVSSASGNAYIQILPDTRKTHNDKMFKGENFSDIPGKLGVISYPVKFKQAGRYYVWVKSYSAGSEDNGVHVGIDGEWPESGQRMQWCEGKNVWTWASKQRTKENHCGEPGKIFLDITKPGKHIIQFSMREDGFTMDQFVLTTDSAFRPVGYIPPAPPKPKPISGAVKTTKKIIDSTKILFMKAVDFDIIGTNFYKEKNNKWLAINPNQYKEASTTMPFPFETAKYDLNFLAVGENDGRSSFLVWVNDVKVIDFTPPLSKEMFEEGSKYQTQKQNIQINKGDQIKVLAKIGSSDGKEYSRGRWSGLEFLKVAP